MRYWDFIDEMREWTDKITALLNQGQISGAIKEQNSLIGSNLLCTYYEHDEWDDSDTRRYVAEKADKTEKECLKEIKEAWKRAWTECSEAARANSARLDEIKSPEKFIPDDIIREMKSHGRNASVHRENPGSADGRRGTAEKRATDEQTRDWIREQARARTRERLTYLSQAKAHKK